MSHQQPQYYAPPPGAPPGAPPGGPPPPGFQSPPPQGYHSPPPQGYPQGQHGGPPPGGPPPQQGFPQSQPAAGPPPGHQQQQQQQQAQYQGFQGGGWKIMFGNTNTILDIHLQQGASIKAKSGSMVHMAATVQLIGKVKLSLRKFLTGSELSESTFTGPGQVVLGPTLFGDIIKLDIDGRSNWIIGKDAYLASTVDVTKENKTQGFSKSMFSGEDFFVYTLGGHGIAWLTSFGAVTRIDLQPGQQHIVDNGHLVAWSCQYSIERLGGSMNAMKSGEGLVCRFTGPGAIYVQTRNKSEFDSYIRAHSASGGS